MEFFTLLTREYATFQIHNRKEHFPNLSNSHRQVIHESTTPPLFAKSRHHHHLHHSMAKHHNHNPRSLKLGDGYSRTIHCPNTVLKRNFRARYRITRQFNPRRPCSSRSQWPSIDNELCPLDTWVSSTMKTAEVRVAS